MTFTTARASRLGEMAFDLADRGDRVLGFLLAVLLIEIEIERTVANIARIWRIEIVGEVGPDIGPFANVNL